MGSTANRRPGKGKPLPGTHRNGTNSVTIGADGAIKVNSGDWISKYAACLYGDPMMGWEEFGRIAGGAKQPRPLDDPNKIRAGEILYHLPTHNASKPTVPVPKAFKGWRYDKTTGVWKCSSYANLNYAEINNFAEYGQPFSPYERGYDHNHSPDFGKIIIEMPQTSVMTGGYGKNVTAEMFPAVKTFLTRGRSLPVGTYRFADLVKRGLAKSGDRWIKSNLYGWGSYGVTAGSIHPGDAAYIHGTISFALMKGTKFDVGKDKLRVEAEIGAGDDNWDFNSSTISAPVNATVAVLLGPDHYNLTAPIQIRYRGKGKQSIVERP